MSALSLHNSLPTLWWTCSCFLYAHPQLVQSLSLITLFNACTLIGLEFWKVGNRRVYAVPRDCSHMVKSKRNGCAVACAEVNSLKNEVMVIKDQMHWLFQIDHRMKISVALQTILQDTFKCHICLPSSHLCMRLQIYHRMWNLYWHMVQRWRWNITKLSTMPQRESTTGYEAGWPRWVSQSYKASDQQSSQLQCGWVNLWTLYRLHYLCGVD